jgi:hypothetical protein
VAISFVGFAVCANTIKDVSFHPSYSSMTSTAGAFVWNAASRAHTRAAFAQNATSGTVSAVSGCFAAVPAVASRFRHHGWCSIARGRADCAHATLLSLRKKVGEASAEAPESRLVGAALLGRLDTLTSAEEGTFRWMCRSRWPCFSKMTTLAGVGSKYRVARRSNIGRPEGGQDEFAVNWIGPPFDLIIVLLHHTLGPLPQIGMGDVSHSQAHHRVVEGMARILVGRAEPCTAGKAPPKGCVHPPGRDWKLGTWTGWASAAVASAETSASAPLAISRGLDAAPIIVSRSA